MKKFGTTLLVAILAISIISGCSSKKSTAKVIEFWTPFTGPDGAYMQKMIDEYNKQTDGLQVKMQVIPGDQYYEKLRTATNSGTGPQVAAIHADQISVMSQGEVITPIENLVQEIGIEENDYVPTGWNAGVYKNERYGIPLDVHPLVLYYNKDIVAKDNLSIPTTYEELIANGKLATKDGQYGMALPTIWPTNLVFRTAMLQNGMDVISEDGKKSNVNSETGLKAATLIQNLWTTEKIAPANLARDGHIDLFKQGKVAFTIDGIWMSQGFSEAKLNFGVAPLGTLFGPTEAVWANSHQLVITNADQDENQLKEITKFIKYLSDNSLEWAKGGQIPANKNVLESEEFKNLEIQYNASLQLGYTKTAPQLDTWVDIWSSIEANLSNGLLGEVSLQEALNKAAKEGEQKAQETIESLK